jgi:hypothetical protein
MSGEIRDVAGYEPARGWFWRSGLLSRTTGRATLVSPDRDRFIGSFKTAPRGIWRIAAASPVSSE